MTTQNGPLDKENVAGDESTQAEGETGSQDEPLAPTTSPVAPADNSAADLEKQKNPLGYTVTLPTENEMDDLTDTDVDETQMEPKAY